MNHFKKILVVIFIFISNAVIAEQFVAGSDYKVLSNQVRTNPKVAALLSKDPKKIQVLFFFSYGCPACARFDPSFEQWLQKKPSKVVVYNFPVTFEDEWLPLAKLYFTVKALDPKQDLSPKIFTAVHERGQKLWQEDEMKKFFVEHGYKEQDFEKVYNAYATNIEVKNANDIISAYKVMSTPTLVVNGAETSYMLSPAMVGGDTKKFFAVLEYLINLPASK